MIRYLSMFLFLGLTTSGCLKMQKSRERFEDQAKETPSKADEEAPLPPAVQGCIGAVQLSLPLNTPLPNGAIMVSSATQLANAINGANEGDTIALAAGNYGRLTITRNMSSRVKITAQIGAIPVFSEIQMNGSFWHISQVSVQPRYSSGADGKTAVSLRGSDNIFDSSLISFATDISGWSASDWVAKAGNGVAISGTRNTVRNNLIQNIDHGIGGNASHSLVENNIINNFRGDGIRALGDNTTFACNTVKNCYKVDGNHDDGFQSWSRGADGSVGTGEVTGVVIRGNYVLSFEDINKPFRCTLQGMGFFDGTFVDWVVENNVVIVDHWHGISFYGSRNVRIVNNTVMDNNPASNRVPWIKIVDHKNGTPSTGGLVRNNLAPDFASAAGVVEDHNIEYTNASAIFANAGAYDFRLKAGSPAIDIGFPTFAPVFDILGNARPRGITHDIGAHEF